MEGITPLVNTYTDMTKSKLLSEITKYQKTCEHARVVGVYAKEILAEFGEKISTFKTRDDFMKYLLKCIAGNPPYHSNNKILYCAQIYSTSGLSLVYKYELEQRFKNFHKVNTDIDTLLKLQLSAIYNAIVLLMSTFKA